MEELVAHERGKNMSINSNPKASIIVPAYNAEKSIELAVRSVLEQTYKQLEVIVIDDGSNDNTGEILNGIAKEDSRLIVIQKKKNEGVSAGRNSGLQMATGEYVGFLDADDWMESQMLEKMFASVEEINPDLIITGYSHDTMDEARRNVVVNKQVRMDACVCTNKQQIIELAAECDSKKIYAYIWNKLYKRKLLVDNKLLFTNQSFNEDFLFNTRFWNFVNSLVVVDGVDYHYIKASKESLAQRFLPDFFKYMDERFESIKELMEINNVYAGETRSKLANVYIKHAIAGIVRNYSKKAHYTFFKRYKLAKQMMKSKNACEARKYASGENKNEKVCNLIFKSRIACVNLLFAKIIYIMQNSEKGTFDKVK